MVDELEWTVTKVCLAMLILLEKALPVLRNNGIALRLKQLCFLIVQYTQTGHTGALWNQAGKSVKAFKYSDNKLHWSNSQTIGSPTESVLCYEYHFW